jgi:prepilin-type N-terminal cleavage/methylation domain-containing protein
MQAHKKNRRGFTLVELLVVISIIAILAALGTWGVFAMIGRQQRRNTETTLNVVHKRMQDCYTSVVKDAKEESPSAAVQAMAGGDPERARVIWVKVRLMEAFPMSFSEVQTPTILNSYILPDRKFKPHFVKYQSTLAGKTPSGTAESSVCLLMALNMLKSDGVGFEDQIRYAISKDPNGLPYLIESLDKALPLEFQRFGTNAIADAANPAKGTSARSAKFADPVDTEGKLIGKGWYGSAACTKFESTIHSISPNAGTDAWYAIPYVRSVSGNIYSFQLRGD